MRRAVGPSYFKKQNKNKTLADCSYNPNKKLLLSSLTYELFGLVEAPPVCISLKSNDR